LTSAAAKNNTIRRPQIGLTEADKKILKVLLEPDGRTSFAKLEKQLGIPRSTIQRRRRYLGAHDHATYSLKNSPNLKCTVLS
jgi:hypothetical protein